MTSRRAVAVVLAASLLTQGCLLETDTTIRVKEPASVAVTAAGAPPAAGASGLLGGRMVYHSAPADLLLVPNADSSVDLVWATSLPLPEGNGIQLMDRHGTMKFRETTLSDLHARLDKSVGLDVRAQLAIEAYHDENGNVDGYSTGWTDGCPSCAVDVPLWFRVPIGDLREVREHRWVRFDSALGLSVAFLAGALTLALARDSAVRIGGASVMGLAAVSAGLQLLPLLGGTDTVVYTGAQ